METYLEGNKVAGPSEQEPCEIPQHHLYSMITNLDPYYCHLHFENIAHYGNPQDYRNDTKNTIPIITHYVMIQIALKKGIKLTEYRRV